MTTVAAAAVAVSEVLSDEDGLKRAAGFSAALHVGVLLFAVFGLPHFYKPLPIEDAPLVVEALPLASITNAPSAAANLRNVPVADTRQPANEQQRPRPQVTPPLAAPPAAPPPPQAAPAPQTPAPPPPPQASQPPPPTPQPVPIPPPPPPLAAPIPTPAPTPTPQPPPPPEPVVAARPPVTPPLPAPPAPPREEPPVQRRAQPPAPTPTPRQQSFNLDNVLRDVRRAQPTQPQAQEPVRNTAAATPAARGAPNSNFNPNQPLSSVEEGSLRGHVEQRWNKDRGAKGIETFVVEVRVWVNAAGVVQDAKVEKTTGSPADSLRAFADSARRAVMVASPLPIPTAKSDVLVNGQLILTFYGQDR